MNTPINHSWPELLEAYLAFFEMRFPGTQRAPGAAQHELMHLREYANARGLHLPNSYVDFLSKVNGTSFDGLVVYGICVPTGDALGRMDFERTNTIVEAPSNITLYGEWNGNVLMHDGKDFGRADMATLAPEQRFGTFEELISSVLTAEVSTFE
jgi:hypothetical protein